MKAVFLDRDGVINVDVAYLFEVSKLKWVNEAREAISYLTHLGYTIFVVTNQSGIARGYYTEKQMQVLHDFIKSETLKKGGKIEKFYHCPHYKDGKVKEFAIDCDCRKPKPGMLLKAMEEYDLDKESSFLIGDKPGDKEAAKAAGIKGYLFTGGNKGESLLEFVQKILLNKEAQENKA
jgi:D-glycero-D-manno-heptose 1,7-bisphosphate phosphatase